MRFRMTEVQDKRVSFPHAQIWAMRFCKISPGDELIVGDDADQKVYDLAGKAGTYRAASVCCVPYVDVLSAREEKARSDSVGKPAASTPSKPPGSKCKTVGGCLCELVSP